jgi:hypothetical protein
VLPLQPWPRQVKKVRDNRIIFGKKENFGKKMLTILSNPLIFSSFGGIISNP